MDDTHGRANYYKILDLRPKSSAMANRTQGYGYEQNSNYPNMHLTFCNIGNIHAVSDSYKKLINLCHSTSANDVAWTQLVEETKWLHHLRVILKASWDCAVTVHYKRLPVLVHCSHGWDRTSQVCALAQLFLDPYYRTYDGFFALVEKDFLSFGHPFHLRAAHGERNSERKESQMAQIFIQFLDCVYQILSQFPSFFEFNGKYVSVIAEHVYSCRFGTFLCDNERDRVRAQLSIRTYSIWDYLESKREFLSNPHFCGKGLLMPPLPCLLRGVHLWSDYFLRYSPKVSLPCMPHALASRTQIYDEMDLYQKDDYSNALLHLTLESALKWRRETVALRRNAAAGTAAIIDMDANGNSNNGAAATEETHCSDATAPLVHQEGQQDDYNNTVVEDESSTTVESLKQRILELERQLAAKTKAMEEKDSFVCVEKSNDE